MTPNQNMSDQLNSNDSQYYQSNSTDDFPEDSSISVEVASYDENTVEDVPNRLALCNQADYSIIDEEHPEAPTNVFVCSTLQDIASVKQRKSNLKRLHYKFECDVCHQRYSTALVLKSHKVRHLDKGKLPFKCKIENCKFAAASKIECDRHYFRHQKWNAKAMLRRNKKTLTPAALLTAEATKTADGQHASDDSAAQRVVAASRVDPGDLFHDNSNHASNEGCQTQQDDGSELSSQSNNRDVFQLQFKDCKTQTPQDGTGRVETNDGVTSITSYTFSINETSKKNKPTARRKKGQVLQTNDPELKDNIQITLNSNDLDSCKIESSHSHPVNNDSDYELRPKRKISECDSLEEDSDIDAEFTDDEATDDPTYMTDAEDIEQDPASITIQSKPKKTKRLTKLQCGLCSFSCRAVEVLRVHLSSSHGHEPRVAAAVACPVCATTFTTATNLRAHLLSHADERQYQCDECDRSFIMKNRLVAHKRFVHCPKTFTCSICSKAFPSIHHLSRHERIHTGVKPYHCCFCAFACNTQGNLVKHVRTRHNRPTYTYKQHLIELGSVSEPIPAAQLQRLKEKGAAVASRVLAKLDRPGLDIAALKEQVQLNKQHKQMTSVLKKQQAGRKKKTLRKISGNSQCVLLPLATTTTSSNDSLPVTSVANKSLMAPSVPFSVTLPSSYLSQQISQQQLIVGAQANQNADSRDKVNFTNDNQSTTEDTLSSGAIISDQCYITQLPDGNIMFIPVNKLEQIDIVKSEIQDTSNDKNDPLLQGTNYSVSYSSEPPNTSGSDMRVVSSKRDVLQEPEMPLIQYDDNTAFIERIRLSNGDTIPASEVTDITSSQEETSPIIQNYKVLGNEIKSYNSASCQSGNGVQVFSYGRTNDSEIFDASPNREILPSPQHGETEISSLELSMPFDNSQYAKLLNISPGKIIPSGLVTGIQVALNKMIATNNDRRGSKTSTNRKNKSIKNACQVLINSASFASENDVQYLMSDCSNISVSDLQVVSSDRQIIIENQNRVKVISLVPYDDDNARKVIGSITRGNHAPSLHQTSLLEQSSSNQEDYKVSMTDDDGPCDVTISKVTPQQLSLMTQLTADDDDSDTETYILNTKEDVQDLLNGVVCNMADAAGGDCVDDSNCKEQEEEDEVVSRVVRPSDVTELNLTREDSNISLQNCDISSDKVDFGKNDRRLMQNSFTIHLFSKPSDDGNSDASSPDLAADATTKDASYIVQFGESDPNTICNLFELPETGLNPGANGSSLEAQTASSVDSNGCFCVDNYALDNSEENDGCVTEMDRFTTDTDPLETIQTVDHQQQSQQTEEHIQNVQDSEEVLVFLIADDQSQEKW